MDPILTNDRGIPLSPPIPPAPGASIDEKIAYIRAKHAHNDLVADTANRAFDVSLRRALRR